MMKEIPRFPKYQVTTDGKVWSDQSQKFLSQKKTKDGYRFVALYANGRREDIGVHRLVAWTYIGAQFDFIEVRHKNGVRDDNRLENLEYGTRSDNARDRVQHGNNYQSKGSRNGQAKLNEEDVARIRYRLSHGDKPKDIANDYGVVKGTIYHIRNSSTWIGP